jgi:hypothetical protein
VGAGVRHGRDAEIVDMRAIADLGLANVTSTAIATRGGRLVLSRARFSDRDHGPETVLTEVLAIVEINADERIVATVTFDLDEIDAAFEELDARYLAGEAAAHSRTWSVIAGAYAALNRRALAATTPDWVNIDHRRLATVEAGDLTAYIRASWDDSPDFSTYIDAVHRLSDLGAVFSQVVRGISHQGFYAEWRGVDILTVDGDLINRCERFDEADIDAAIARFDELHPRADLVNRCEMYDEADLEAALARFEELHPQPRRLENAAGRIVERNFACFSARDWAAMAELLADDIVVDDRRRVVNAGIRRGRDVYIADNQAAIEVGAETISSSVIATRGERLALAHVRSVNRGLLPGEFGAEMLGIAEIDADERIVAAVIFDSDDTDAAFEELEARYLVGEAAAHAHAWSVIAGTYAAFNRHEFPSTTPDSVYIDHRPLLTNDATDLAANIRASWDLMDVSIYIAERVHRLSELGAVVTQSWKGTSKEGLDVESRMIDIFTVEGDLLSRCEVFDEADLDAALARFDELHPRAPRLENAATKVDQRFWTHFAARHWDAMSDLLANGIWTEDRRRVVNAGVRHGRDDHIAEMRAVVEVGVESITSTVVAIRGSRLALTLICGSNREIGAGEVSAEVLNIVQIDADDRILARIGFDVDDIHAAFEELDARYLAGEAAAHADTWLAIAQAYTAVNRHELPPTTPDWANIDHRRGRAFAPGDLEAYLHATWDLAPDVDVYVEAVHRLSNLGGIVTHCAHGSSQEGFDAEWREVILLTFEAGQVNRSESFDEADLDAALARFDELDQPTPA